MLFSTGIDKESIVEKNFDKFKHLAKDISPTKAFATASRLVLEHLTVRKNAVREFLNAVRIIREQPIDERVFEKYLHTSRTFLRQHINISTI